MPAEQPPAERDDAAAASTHTAGVLVQDIFTNPLPAAAIDDAAETNGEAAPQHSPVSWSASEPHAAANAAAVVAQLAAQPPADENADMSEAHALLPPRHADSGAQSPVDDDITAHHSGAVQQHGQGDSDNGSMSADSPAAGRPPDCSAATMANPYWQIDGAMRNPLTEQPPVELHSSRGHQVLH
jgi:hypothetical protein